MCKLAASSAKVAGGLLRRVLLHSEDGDLGDVLTGRAVEISTLREGRGLRHSACHGCEQRAEYCVGRCTGHKRDDTVVWDQAQWPVACERRGMGERARNGLVDYGVTGFGLVAIIRPNQQLAHALSRPKHASQTLKPSDTRATALP